MAGARPESGAARARQRQGAGAPLDTPEEIARRLAELMHPSTVIVGVGNELRGDDGAGVVVADRLAGRVPWLVLDAGMAPENFLGKLLDGRPESVVLIDAAAVGAPPGTVLLLGREDLTEASPGTHGPSLLPVLEWLDEAGVAPCAVLGIQPQRGDFGRGLSQAVGAAVERIVQAFGQLCGAEHGPEHGKQR